MEHKKALKTEPKSIIVRIAPDIFDSIAEIAKNRSVSMNSLVNDGLCGIIREQEDEESYKGYTLLGRAGEDDIDYAMAAQSEIMHSE